MQVKETQLAWLAGIIDGEGCIGAFRKTRKHRSGNTTMLPVPYVTIVNSSHSLMVEVESILKALGVSAYGFHESRNGTNRLMKRFAIKNLESILTLLDAVIPYLVAKRVQAEVMREFLKICGGRTSNVEERMPYFYRLQELKQADRLTP